MSLDFSLIDRDILDGVADAIRYVDGTSAGIAPKDFAARVRELKYPKPTWLYFTMPEGGTVSLTKNGTPTEVTLEYSLDNGSTWTEWVESAGVRSLTLNAGQTMHVRNTSETSTRFSTGLSDRYIFAFTSITYSGGNINSLLCKIPENVLLYSAFCFSSLFRDAVNLITPPLFPVTNLYDYCFHTMFRGCTSLTKSPILQNTILADTCYYYMFYDCSSLNEVYTYMTDISANGAIYLWLGGVAATGDFYCPSELTIPTGNSGIPSGWTRHDI